MRENTIRTIWNEGGTAVNGWLHIPSTWSAELMAKQGFDSLTIDMQHGMMDYGMTVMMLQAISTTDVMPLVRVNWNEPGIIMKVLDAGAMGVICPMVNTREEAGAFVGACRYSPRGYRSQGPTRARWYAGADYVQAANDTVLAIAMIETDTAMANLDAILSTPELDAIYVGPGDLNLCLNGRGGIDIEETNFLDALDRILEGCQRNGLKAGIHCGSVAYAKRMEARGFQFISLQSDGNIMANASRNLVEQMRGGDDVSDERGSAY